MKNIIKTILLCTIISTHNISAINTNSAITIPTKTIKNMVITSLLIGATATIDAITYVYTHDLKKVAIVSTLPLAIFIAYKLGKKTNSNTIQTAPVAVPVVQNNISQDTQNQGQPVQQIDETLLLPEQAVIGQYLADQAQYDHPTTVSHIVNQYIELTQKDH